MIKILTKSAVLFKGKGIQHYSDHFHGKLEEGLYIRGSDFMAHILQVVGYKNSGKTTLVEKIVSYLKKKHVRVATIKHHGHGGGPYNVEGKDSVRHRLAGADVSGVEGGGLFSLSIKKEKWMLDELIELYRFFSIEMIIVEGYKEEAYPKICLVKSKEDAHMLKNLSNVLLVLTWGPIPEGPYPVYSIHSNEFTEWLGNYFKEVMNDESTI